MENVSVCDLEFDCQKPAASSQKLKKGSGVWELKGASEENWRLVWRAETADM
jgi:hypothetical protein